MSEAIELRRPTERDHRAIVAVIDDWWGGRRVRQMLPRLWLQHFAGTSWIAETSDGRLAGFLVGFVSPDRVGEAYVHLVAANPNLRRQGVGRRLYETFVADVRARDVHRVTAVTWPGNRGSIAFHRALGFRVVDEGATPVYGTPAFADYDDTGEDRVVFELAT